MNGSEIRLTARSGGGSDTCNTRGDSIAPGFEGGGKFFIMMIDETKSIIDEAIKKYRPIQVILMLSGGHDSVTNAHISARILDEMDVDFLVYHGDTTIGIPDTQKYVIGICAHYGWDLKIRTPPNKKDWYENLVARFGFPGPTRFAHQIMYRSLKERALKKFITHEIKSSPRLRQNVLLLTGVRKQESRIRMGYQQTTTKEDSRVWCNPIFNWSDEDCRAYMRFNEIPLNPVKEKMCISGECLCGAFAGREEWAELKFNYPEVAAKIEALHEKAKQNGFPWAWSSGPTEWRNQQKQKAQLNMFMCAGCESRKDFMESAP